MKLVSDKFKEIENSEEFKKSIQENENNDIGYKNEVANKVLNTSTVIFIIGFLISIIESYNLYSNHENIGTIIVFFIIIIGIGMIFSVLFKGLAEVIELLQSIKEK